MQPVGVYEGKVPHPYTHYGFTDIELNAPTTFNHIGTRWADTQLSNGWMNTTALRLGSIYQNAGYLNVIQPQIPGQSRLYPSGYPVKGPAPSQVAQAYAQTAGQQPMYPGGPGQMLAPNGINYAGGSGA